jgi:hypothetical protein
MLRGAHPKGLALRARTGARLFERGKGGVTLVPSLPRALERHGDQVRRSARDRAGRR